MGGRASWLPPWVTFLDLLTLALAGLTIGVIAGGGFRETVGPIRLSVRSWERVFLLMATATVLRHALVMRPSLIERLWDGTRALWRARPASAPVWGPWLATRLGVLVVGYLAVVTIGYEPGTERFRVSDNEFVNLPARWDAGWYRDIATNGYRWDGNPLREQNVVFFPAFPMAMRVVGLFLGERWLLAGLVVSLTAFLWALAYVFRLARDMLGAERAHAAVWLLCAYPFAVYYSAPYTESLYLLSAVGAFFHARKQEAGPAAAWGIVAGLCRPNGFFIAAPIGLLALERLWRERRLDPRDVVATCAPLVGVALYSAYLYATFGDALAWARGQAAWERVFVGLWPGLQALIVDRYVYIAAEGFYRYTMSLPFDFLHALAALFVLGTIVPIARRLGLPLAVLTLINIGPPLVMGGMMSIGRMTSVLFPVFLWLALVIPPRHLTAWIAAFAVLQGLIAALFFTWRPVF